MHPLIFRKEDASSCLVPDKTWDDIIGKPDLFEVIADRILEMADEANKVQLLSRGASLKTVKRVINKVLLDILKVPLPKAATDDSSTDDSDSEQTNETRNVVYADAFWDEIGDTSEFSVKLKSAIEKAYVMRQRIEQSSPLTDASSLQDVKNLVNTAVLNPLQGADKGE